MEHTIQQLIKNATQVVEHYGYWPTFHDAEMISLSIMPAAETISATFAYNDEPNDEKRSGSSLITLHWQAVVSYTLQADYVCFHMNTLYEINFVEQDGWIESELVPIDGVNGKIRSQEVQVTRFEVLPE